MELWNGLVDWTASLFDWIVTLKADEWSAIGTVGTLAVAGVAAVFAWIQVRDARRLRVEQARPYVAAYLELGNEIDVTFILLVVKNFGTTTARDITVTSDKPMKRAWGNSHNPEELLLFEKLPVLVPGQSWRTLFDWGPDRFKAGLDEVYTLTLKSHDSGMMPLKDETFVLDWNTFKPTRNVGVKTVHDIGKSIKEIEKTLGKWTEGNRGLSVVTRDGHRKDDEATEDYEERTRLWAEEKRLHKDTVIEQVSDATNDTAFYRSAGEEEELSSYPEPAEVEAEAPEGGLDAGPGADVPNPAEPDAAVAVSAERDVEALDEAAPAKAAQATGPDAAARDIAAHTAPPAESEDHGGPTA